mmetsp:Transcript_9405/g.18284  ORF Transcript_9405/g.18284 Transcript_9405/m.18284 type:complete len:146 (-) Transcript_9405:605-1042(-)
MPNFCQNALTVKHADAEVLRTFYEENRFGDTELAFEKAVPRSSDEGKLDNDWCIENWGTKWSAREVRVDKSDSSQLCYTFDSAWTPPKAWLKKVVEKYPDLDLELESTRSRTRTLAGSAVIETGNGKKTSTVYRITIGPSSTKGR